MKTKYAILDRMLLLAIGFIAPFRGNALEIKPYELSLAQLGQIPCYTASRDMGSVESAPTVI